MKKNISIVFCTATLLNTLCLEYGAAAEHDQSSIHDMSNHCLEYGTAAERDIAVSSASKKTPNMQQLIKAHDSDTFSQQSTASSPQSIASTVTPTKRSDTTHFFPLTAPGTTYPFSSTDSIEGTDNPTGTTYPFPSTDSIEGTDDATGTTYPFPSTDSIEGTDNPTYNEHSPQHLERKSPTPERKPPTLRARSPLAPPPLNPVARMRLTKRKNREAIPQRTRAFLDDKRLQHDWRVGPLL